MTAANNSVATAATAVAPTWYRITILEAAFLAELLSASLFELGASGVQEVGADLIAYFSPNAALPELEAQLTQRLRRFHSELQLTAPLQFNCTRVAQENWQQNWTRHFKPVRIGRRLIVTPSWIQPSSVVARQIVLTIDPEQAFGTGHHATTFMMLMALLKLHRPHLRVLDVGTGSGILAIAAAKLGSEKITAFDLDPVAIVTAATNARRNGSADQIRFFAGGLSSLSPRQTGYDLILANLSSGIFKSLLPRFGLYLQSGGRLVLSGILVEEREKLCRWLADLNYTIVNSQEKEEWLCLICSKK